MSLKLLGIIFVSEYTRLKSIVSVISIFNIHFSGSYSTSIEYGSGKSSGLSHTLFMKDIIEEETESIKDAILRLELSEI